MHTVHLLEESIRVAEQLGYAVRHEWLGGETGGSCEIAGKKWLFVDLALSPVDQLDQVITALRSDPELHRVALAPALRDFLQPRRAA